MTLTVGKESDCPPCAARAEERNHTTGTEKNAPRYGRGRRRGRGRRNDITFPPSNSTCIPALVSLLSFHTYYISRRRRLPSTSPISSHTTISPATKNNRKKKQSTEQFHRILVHHFLVVFALFDIPPARQIII